MVPRPRDVMLGWRLPAATDPSNDVADIVGSVLYNGQAGLIDLDLNQQQKVLSAYAYASTQPDYGIVPHGWQSESRAVVGRGARPAVWPKQQRFAPESSTKS